MRYIGSACFFHLSLLQYTHEWMHKWKGNISLTHLSFPHLACPQTIPGHVQYGSLRWAAKSEWTFTCTAQQFFLYTLCRMEHTLVCSGIGQPCNGHFLTSTCIQVSQNVLKGQEVGIWILVYSIQLAAINVWEPTIIGKNHHLEYSHQ